MLTHWQTRGAASTVQEISVLDNAFVLIEGHPSSLNQDEPSGFCAPYVLMTLSSMQ
jgi:hypothetical protein